MSEAVRLDPDRLPWLSDAPVAKTDRSRSNWAALSGWAVAVALAIAGGAYWLGTQSGQPSGEAVRANLAPDSQLKVPEPAAQPQVEIAKAPEVRPAPVPVVAVPEPPLAKSPRAVAAPSSKPQTASQQPAPPPAKPVSVAPAPQPLALWPSRQVKGAAGRLVQIGAFGSREQAKLGWRHMQRAYPAVGRLPAVVVEARNSRGRKFYRFQIGTTSHAHSEVLCQRMERIRFSCAVIGLPWKAKVER
jgi:hypothetical protein